MSETSTMQTATADIHLWGSYPAPDLDRGLSEVITTVGPRLAFGVPNLELDTPDREWKDWVVGNLKRLEKTRGIVVLEQGDYSDYDKFSKLDIGAEGLDPYDIQLGHYERAKETAPYIINELEAQGVEKPLQIGIPGYRQLPTFAFGKIKGMLPKYTKPFAEATRHDMIRLARDEDLNRHGIGIQVENPVETLASYAAWEKNRFLGRRVAKVMAHNITRQVSDLPYDMATAVHNCLGRFRGKPAGTPDPEVSGSYESTVTLINETKDAWPKRHQPAKIMGIPVVAEGRGLPSEKGQREVAAQIGDIVLHEDTALVLGIITYDTPAIEAARYYSRIREKYGREVVVGAPCGLQSLRLHEDPNAAFIVLKRHVEVADMLRRG